MPPGMLQQMQRQMRSGGGMQEMMKAMMQGQGGDQFDMEEMQSKLDGYGYLCLLICIYCIKE
jgi:signal recognition particle subunit SRP54